MQSEFVSAPRNISCRCELATQHVYYFGVATKRGNLSALFALNQETT
jgi:hypothetical protein